VRRVTFTPESSFDRFFERLDAPERELVLVNRASPTPVYGMLTDLFADQPVEVEEASVPDVEGDTVLLLEDGEVVATSPLSALNEAVLMVNSDLYVTGTRDVEELVVPDVLAGLQEVPFNLRGYPESNTEKLLLIVVSRYIERRAWLTGSGVHRASFQRLSRIEDERGTSTVYATLAETDVDVHVYGLPDWTPPVELSVTMHGGYDDTFRRTWFVLFVPPDGPGAPESMALVARETRPRRWEAFWTTDGEFVGDVNRHVERTL